MTDFVMMMIYIPLDFMGNLNHSKIITKAKYDLTKSAIKKKKIPEEKVIDKIR